MLRALNPLRFLRLWGVRCLFFFTCCSTWEMRWELAAMRMVPPGASWSASKWRRAVASLGPSLSRRGWRMRVAGASQRRQPDLVVAVDAVGRAAVLLEVVGGGLQGQQVSVCQGDLLGMEGEPGGYGRMPLPRIHHQQMLNGLFWQIVQQVEQQPGGEKLSESNSGRPTAVCIPNLSFLYSTSTLSRQNRPLAKAGCGASSLGAVKW
jgi:hypothetical protein